MASKKTDTIQDAVNNTVHAAASMFSAGMFSDAWKNAIDEQVTRVAATHEEMQRNASQFAGQYNDAIDEIARLWKAQFSYTAQLQEQWRNAAVDAARRTTDLMTPPAA